MTTVLAPITYWCGACKIRMSPKCQPCAKSPVIRCPKCGGPATRESR